MTKQRSNSSARHLQVVDAERRSAARKKNTRPNYRRIAFLVLFVALLAWAVYPIKFRIEQRRELGRLQAEVAELKEENVLLRGEIARLKSDEYIERLARERLGLVKPGEEPIIVISGEDEAGRREVNQQAARPSIWQRVYGFFAGLLR